MEMAKQPLKPVVDETEADRKTVRSRRVSDDLDQGHLRPASTRHRLIQHQDGIAPQLGSAIHLWMRDSLEVKRLIWPMTASPLTPRSVGIHWPSSSTMTTAPRRQEVGF